MKPEKDKADPAERYHEEKGDSPPTDPNEFGKWLVDRATGESSPEDDADGTDRVERKESPQQHPDHTGKPPSNRAS